MPKDTFNNLSEEKKRRIFNAAIQEFSTRRFSEASINQIVKAAKIPRGSFYQYFEDKEDIFLYMFNEILKEKREVIKSRMTISPESDVFDTLFQATKVSLEWGREKPEYTKISMLMETDDSDFIDKLRSYSAKGLKEMVERDKRRGVVKPDIDTDLIVDIIYTLIVKEYFWIGLDEDLFIKRVNDIITILKNGIAIA